MCRARPADDAILDEAFLRERWLSSFPRTLAFLATDVAAAARKRGFQGVTVVLTGSSRVTSRASARCTSTSAPRREPRCPSSPPVSPSSPPKSGGRLI